MAVKLYEAFYENEENRTLIISFALLIAFFFSEIYLLFWPEAENQALTGFLFWEIDFLGVTYLPWLAILHLIIWVSTYFIAVVAYANVRDLAGSMAGLIDIGVIALILSLFNFIMFSSSVRPAFGKNGVLSVGLFFLGCGLVVLYLYSSLEIEETKA